MKKLFLAGALTVAMAFSSTAFAAVEYGQNETLQVEYDDILNTASVTTNLSSYEGQMTILILNSNTSEIVAENIIYIDQAAAGEDIFKNMGVLLPEGADKLPAGTYYVKVGGENVKSILVATFTITEEGEGKDFTFTWGDVNGQDGLSQTDALDILSSFVGGSATVGISEYALGATLSGTDGSQIIWGDVNGQDGLSQTDALDILSSFVGGSASVGTSQYALGESVTIKLPN